MAKQVSSLHWTVKHSIKRSPTCINLKRSSTLLSVYHFILICYQSCHQDRYWIILVKQYWYLSFLLFGWLCTSHCFQVPRSCSGAATLCSPCPPRALMLYHHVYLCTYVYISHSCDFWSSLFRPGRGKKWQIGGGALCYCKLMHQRVLHKCLFTLKLCPETLLNFI